MDNIFIIKFVILAAMEEGKLERAAYENYQKMVKERIHFQANIVEKRRKDKEFGKLYKAFKKIKKQDEL